MVTYESCTIWRLKRFWNHKLFDTRTSCLFSILNCSNQSPYLCVRARLVVSLRRRSTTRVSTWWGENFEYLWEFRRLGCVLFSKFFLAQPCTDRSQWAEYDDAKFFKIFQCLPCLWVIFDKDISHVIVTKTIYFLRYCKKRNSTENSLEV